MTSESGSRFTLRPIAASPNGVPWVSPAGPLGPTADCTVAGVEVLTAIARETLATLRPRLGQDTAVNLLAKYQSSLGEGLGVARDILSHIHKNEEDVVESVLAIAQERREAAPLTIGHLIPPPQEFYAKAEAAPLLAVLRAASTVVLQAVENGPRFLLGTLNPIARGLIEEFVATHLATQTALPFVHCVWIDPSCWRDLQRIHELRAK